MLFLPFFGIVQFIEFKAQDWENHISIDISASFKRFFCDEKDWLQMCDLCGQRDCQDVCDLWCYGMHELGSPTPHKDRELKGDLLD